MDNSTFEKQLTQSVPLPMCVVDKNGKIVGANSKINEVFIYDEITGSDFFTLTGIKLEDLINMELNEEFPTIERNDKNFRLIVNSNNDSLAENTFVFFEDITSLVLLEASYEDEKTCTAIIRIDNYDELIASTLPDMRMQISTNLDKTIRKWAGSMNASIVNNKEDEYMMYFHYGHLKKIIESKFAILDEVRQIETEADFPMSLSIGVGTGGGNLQEMEEEAVTALDLATGRGGDQAVVKNHNQIDYYGGRLQTVEKTNKGKSRVIAHILKQLIADSGKIMIMGHTNPDMDCFGASLGMYRVCKMQDREPNIVLDEVNHSLSVIYKQAKNTGRYNFISGEKALEMADEDTLLIVVDTHRPSYVSCPDLLNKVGKLAVIDHHRRAADAIKDADLFYIESYASSASELVSEILQYSGEKRALQKLEAEALLGGITIDTNRFAVKTGVRTFEAAAWLRRSGADTTEVKRFFQVDMDSFSLRAKSIAGAKIHDNGIATSTCKGQSIDAQVINSQVADELLNINGVRASFVAGRNVDGRTVVSARSLGEINVQVIMEKLGGGGHLTTAGAQVDVSPEEILEKIIEIIDDGEEK